MSGVTREISEYHEQLKDKSKVKKVALSEPMRLAPTTVKTIMRGAYSNKQGHLVDTYSQRQRQKQSITQQGRGPAKKCEANVVEETLLSFRNGVTDMKVIL